MAALCVGLRLCVAWRGERVCTMCVQRAERVKVLFVLADGPALLTFLHRIRSHSCIALNAVGVSKVRREKFSLDRIKANLPFSLPTEEVPSLMSAAALTCFYS